MQCSRSAQLFHTDWFRLQLLQVRGLLVAGSKSFTHTLVALERYQALLQTLLELAGPQVCPDMEHSE